MVEAKGTRAAELRACFGPTAEPALQNFYAEIKLGAISFRGNGECRAVKVDFPQAGLFPVRCQLVLSGLPAPYVGGLLTTNTMTSKAAFGGDTDPARIHTGLDRNDPPLEGYVSRVRCGHRRAGVCLSERRAEVVGAREALGRDAARLRALADPVLQLRPGQRERAPG